MVKNLLLTGRPGVGKTTLIVRLLQGLEGVAASGFYTQEIRLAGQRLGFRAVTLAGKEAVLAHSDSPSTLRVSRYGVELTAFEEHIVPSIDPALTPAELLVVDEIGRMECYSARFREAAAGALDSEKVVLATIARYGEGFIGEVRRRADVELVEVTYANRDVLVAVLLGRLKALLHSSSGRTPS